jgi:hypothetical protein
VISSRTFARPTNRLAVPGANRTYAGNHNETLVEDR